MALSATKKIKQGNMMKSSWEEVDKKNFSEDRIFEKSLNNKGASANGNSGGSVSVGDVRLCCRTKQPPSLCDIKQSRLVSMSYFVSRSREAEVPFSLQDPRLMDRPLSGKPQLPRQRGRNEGNGTWL